MKAQSNIAFQLVFSTLVVLMLVLSAIAETPNPEDSSLKGTERATVSTSGQGRPDNTAVNKRDRHGETKTAGDQALNDTQTISKIRESLVADDSLSTYAQNVKIVSENGKVTLRGPVRTEQERQQIESKAANVVGMGNVRNELEVSPRQRS